jgi:GH15 family glucan-1,4-alpha-glucosidase
MADQMRADKAQIQQLLESTRQVILDCAQQNGAIVAANSRKGYFPKEAKDYFFVWPRDGAYACVAADKLGMREIPERFFRWCMQAEGWKRTGLFYEKYYVDGKKARHNFQPDQTGAVLWAVHEHYKDESHRRNGQGRKLPAEIEKLITGCAEGLCKVWSKDHFSTITQDLWEERYCFPDLKESFCYSLAACAHGLACANELLPNPAWAKAAQEMRATLLSSKGRFARSTGTFFDKRIDGSLPGLVWPFRMISADDPRMAASVAEMEQLIAKDCGVHRYEGDDYDGWMLGEWHRKKGAGYWPLLSFWMAIYYAEKGERRKAMRYYSKVLGDIRGEFIPEQIFDNDVQQSVSPLCWSHCMFFFATERLGLLPKKTDVSYKTVVVHNNTAHVTHNKSGRKSNRRSSGHDSKRVRTALQQAALPNK